MKNYLVPVFLWVCADSPAAAADEVYEALGSDEFMWPDSLGVVGSTVANPSEVVVLNEDGLPVAEKGA